MSRCGGETSSVTGRNRETKCCTKRRRRVCEDISTTDGRFDRDDPAKVRHTVSCVMNMNSHGGLLERHPSTSSLRMLHNLHQLSATLIF